MSIIIKTGNHHPLDPTNITHGKYTTLQNAFLRMFPNTNKDHFRLIRANPGEEILVFQEIITRVRDTPLIIRDDRGSSIVINSDIDVINPPDDFLLAIIRNLAIAYEQGSRRSDALKKAILSIKDDTPIYYINASNTTHTSFIYDGHKKETSERLVKLGTSKNIISKAIERAREAIQSEETSALSVLTPAQAQDDLINLLLQRLKVGVIRNKEDTDWDMELKVAVSLNKLYPLAFLTNRGFLRATHSGMLLPDDAPNQVIRHIESVGKTIAQSRKLRDREFFGDIISSVEMKEYIAKEDTLKADSKIVPISSANPYELKSAYAFNRFRPKLNPVL